MLVMLGSEVSELSGLILLIFLPLEYRQRSIKLILHMLANNELLVLQYLLLQILDSLNLVH